MTKISGLSYKDFDIGDIVFYYSLKTPVYTRVTYKCEAHKRVLYNKFNLTVGVDSIWGDFWTESLLNVDQYQNVNPGYMPANSLFILQKFKKELIDVEDEEFNNLFV